jgi:hypothetical protein
MFILSNIFLGYNLYKKAREQMSLELEDRHRDEELLAMKKR